MEEKEISKKKYELAYLLSPNLSEEEAAVWGQKISSLVSQTSGEIVDSASARKIKLAYPIKRNWRAYFGVVNFFADPEKITDLDKKLKFEDDLLRHLIVFLDKKAEAAKKAALPAFGEEKFRPVAVKAGAKFMIPEAELKTAAKPAEKVRQPAEEKKATLEEIEKKLEKILGE